MPDMKQGSSEQQIVVFHLWPALPYGLRMLLAFGLVAGGGALQVLAFGQLLPGIVLILAGNLLLLVRGYDQRAKAGSFDAKAAWEQVTPQKLDEVEKLNKRIASWDRSALDITSGWGFFVLLLFMAAPVLYLWGNAEGPWSIWKTLACDAIVLLAPHWVTGVRRILTTPTLVMKVRFFRDVLKRAGLGGATVEYLMLLKGSRARFPDDVKARVSFPGQSRDFLGLHLQVATNSVKGTAYPYFYVVLVAKAGFGLNAVHDKYAAPRNVTKEMKRQDDVEVLVIRQTTTQTSGYHTPEAVAGKILQEGLKLGTQVASGSMK